MQHTRFLSGSPHPEGGPFVSAGARFSIGGLEYLLSGGDVPLLLEPDERYRPFLVEDGANVAPGAVRLRFELCDPPPCDGRVILRSAATWSLLALGSDRLFVFRYRAEPEPQYVARFRPGSCEVSILCSPRLLETVGGVRVLRSPFRYPFDQILTMYLLGTSGLILHAAGLVMGDSGVAFSGVSGAGKSTLCRLGAERPRWTFLSDDRLVARLVGERAEIHGTPWAGEAGVVVNRRCLMSWLLFLEQGETNLIRRLEPKHALRRLFATASLPWFDAEYLGRGLAACEGLVRTVPSALLAFRPDAGAFDAVERLLAAAR